MSCAFIDIGKKNGRSSFFANLCRSHRVVSARAGAIGQRLCDDMVILVHICEQHGLGLENYSRTLMTEELHDLVMSVGHRWGARLRRANRIKIIRTQKYKAVTEGNHALNIAPGLLDQDFSAPG